MCRSLQVSAYVPEYTVISLCSLYSVCVSVFIRAHFYISKPECMSFCMECMKWE